MNRLRVLFTLYISLVPVLYAFSQTTTGQNRTLKTITTAVPFLTITPDSRAAGMGDVGVATSPDINSVYWNVGKLAFIDKDYGVSLSYTPWLAKIINDMFLSDLKGFYKIGKWQTVGLSMKYFNLGTITLNKGPDPEDELGSFNSRDFALDVAYSRILTPHLSIGGALRYIHSNLIGNTIVSGGGSAAPSNSVAVDVGVYYSKLSNSKLSNFAFGATITNIGSKISYFDANNAKTFIPTNLRLGWAYTRNLNAFNSLTFALDLNKLLVPSPTTGSQNKNLLEGIFGSFADAPGGFEEELHEISLAMGVEYWYNNIFSGRIGYFLEADDKGNRKYFTLGAGARTKKFGIDIAYLIPTNGNADGRQNALAETIRFTAMLYFNKKEISEQEVYPSVE